MSSESEKLLSTILSLPQSERAELAARLLESLDPRNDEDVDAAWAEEIERRCAASDAGTIVSSDWDEVRRRIERDVFGR